jgi:outer membrane protein OmpA-like peptidoglycan-associated protein
MGRQHLQFRLVLGLAFCCIAQLPKAHGQQNPYDQSNQPAEDVPGCSPQIAGLSPLPMSVVTSCQKSDSVELTLPLKPDANGQAQEKRVRGGYEFREYSISELEREHAFDNLIRLIPMAGFVVKYSSKPSTITARNGDTWMLVSVGDESYNVSVVVAAEESWTPVKTAEEISREMKARGRVDIYGIEFSPKDQSIGQADILSEILKYLNENPDVSIVIESHKITTSGTPEDDSEITRERANAVMDWLVAHKIQRSRVQPRPCGRNNPIADNESPTGAQRNERIVLVKINP